MWKSVGHIGFLHVHVHDERLSFPISLPSIESLMIMSLFASHKECKNLNRLRVCLANLNGNAAW